MTFEEYCIYQYHASKDDECIDFQTYMWYKGKALKENYDKYIKG